MAALDLGDVVQLRTGSPPMIVVEYGTQDLHPISWLTPDRWIEDPDSFICIWWEGEVRYQGLFSRYQLEKS
ncbi:DUF2158 domain-containing protein [Spirosoma luteum]|uniref:DUF2158 domain-containing protein n=1 Tax=Spirosoma luteum TaxID=431553 RepID=UPI000381445B|nr:DUF2158 domain-containing protein [Spirosoma luteum]